MAKLHRRSKSKAVWAATTAGGAFLLLGAGSLVMQNITPGFSVWNTTATSGITTSSATWNVAVTNTFPSGSFSNMVPGDYVEGTVTISNTGTTDLGSLVAAVSNSPSTLNQWLDVNIQSCSSAWTASGTSAPITYTCTPGATSLGSTTIGAIITSGYDLTGVTTTPTPGNVNFATTNTSGGACTGMSSCTGGGTDYLMFTITLDSATPAQTTSVNAAPNFNFTASQVTGTAL